MLKNVFINFKENCIIYISTSQNRIYARKFLDGCNIFFQTQLFILSIHVQTSKQYMLLHKYLNIKEYCCIMSNVHVTLHIQTI